MPTPDEIAAAWQAVQQAPQAQLAQGPAPSPPASASPPPSPMGPIVVPRSAPATAPAGGFDPRDFGAASGQGAGFTPAPDGPQSQADRRKEWAQDYLDSAGQKEAKTPAQAELERVKALTDKARISGPVEGVSNPNAGHNAGPSAVGTAANEAALRVRAMEQQGMKDTPEMRKAIEERDRLAQAQAAERIPEQARMLAANDAQQLAAQAARESFEDAQRKTAAKQAYDAEKTKQAMDRFNKLHEDLSHDRINSNPYAGKPLQGGLAALGAALGGIGAVYGHTDNFAMKMLEANAERNMQAQRENHQIKKDAVEGARSEYSMFRDQGMDDQSAAAATKSTQLQRNALKMNELAATTQNEQFKQQLTETARQAAMASQQQKVAAESGLQRQMAMDRDKALAAGSGAGAGAEKAVADYDLKNLPQQRAAADLDSEDTIEGYDWMGRARHAISPAVESDEGRANRRRVDDLVAAHMKAIGMSTRGDAVEKYRDQHVRNEKDVRELVADSREETRAGRDLSRTKGSGGKDRKGPEEAEEDER